jgi:septal ring factor EnvC (AmiA/AmiB activator)
MFLFLACNQGKIDELTEKVNNLEAQNLQLQEENNSIKAYVEEMAQLIESVGEDLENITRTEVDIRKLTEGGKPGTLEGELKEKLGNIGKYIIDTREKINDLDKQLAESKHNVQGLRSMVKNLKSQLADKETEVATLLEEIGVMQADIDRMGVEIKDKETMIADQESLIEEQVKRYYVVAKEGDLKKNGIIMKQGGFLGIGKSTKISPELDTQYLTQINALDDKQIDIPYNVKKLKILSPHSAGSYELTGDANQSMLTILDPNKFWASSKYLVIAMK